MVVHTTGSGTEVRINKSLEIQNHTTFLFLRLFVCCEFLSSRMSTNQQYSSMSYLIASFSLEFLRTLPTELASLILHCSSVKVATSIILCNEVSAGKTEGMLTLKLQISHFTFLTSHFIKLRFT